MESMDVSRISQSRLSVSLLQAAALGHRRDLLQHRWSCPECNDAPSLVAEVGTPRPSIREICERSLQPEADTTASPQRKIDPHPTRLKGNFRANPIHALLILGWYDSPTRLL